MVKQKITRCPSPQYQEYKPDLATRQAQAKAAKDQPPMISVASTIPPDYSARLDRSDAKK